MRTSKLILTVILLCVITSLTGCTQDQEKGAAMAVDFVKAWNGDNDSLKMEVENINAVVDSLTFKRPFVNAFIDEASKSDSTIALAAKVLLKNGDDVSSEMCTEIINGLADGTLNYTQANAKIMQFADVCTKLNKENLNKSFGKMLDEYAAALSIDKQMKVYSAATTPEKLGEAMKEDAKAPNADKALIKRQVEALKSIYNTEDYKKFIDSYKND